MKKLILAVVAATLATPVLAEDLMFTLTNSASQPINELYVSPHDSDEWGADILGVDVLAPGGSGSVTVTGGSEICDFDLKFVMEDGQELSGTENLCETESVDIHE